MFAVDTANEKAAEQIRLWGVRAKERHAVMRVRVSKPTLEHVRASKRYSVAEFVSGAAP